MRLIFARHAESTANREGRWQGHADYPLSTKGQAQAVRLANSLAQEFGQHAAEGRSIQLYASPLTRAQATAQAIGVACGLSVIQEPALIEYDVGIFSGRTWAEIESDCPSVAQAFNERRDWDVVPGAERFAERAERAQAVLKGLFDRHQDGDVLLCVTHGGFLQYLLAAVLNTQRIWGVRPGNTAIFDFVLTKAAQASDHHAPDGLSPYLCRIQRFNDQSHLSNSPDAA